MCVYARVSRFVGTSPREEILCVCMRAGALVCVCVRHKVFLLRWFRLQHPSRRDCTATLSLGYTHTLFLYFSRPPPLCLSHSLPSPSIRPLPSISRVCVCVRARARSLSLSPPPMPSLFLPPSLLSTPQPPSFSLSLLFPLLFPFLTLSNFISQPRTWWIHDRLVALTFVRWCLRFMGCRRLCFKH